MTGDHDLTIEKEPYRVGLRGMEHCPVCGNPQFLCICEQLKIQKEMEYHRDNIDKSNSEPSNSWNG